MEGLRFRVGLGFRHVGFNMADGISCVECHPLIIIVSPCLSLSLSLSLSHYIYIYVYVNSIYAYS